MRIRSAALVLLALLFAACTTTDVRVATISGQQSAKGAKVLVVYPDVQLGLLTANGMTEPREDWSRTSASNLAQALESALAARSYAHHTLDAQESTTGRAAQVLRLNTAVGQSIAVFEYGPLRLPNKAGEFDWSLGSGARTLASAHSANYALFVTGQGTFTSGGRMALALGAAVLGVGIPTGAQQVYMSLVELESGRVLWFNVATAGSGTDIRESTGARTIVDELLETAPL